MKKRITEAQLRDIVAESVKKVLFESTLYTKDIKTSDLSVKVYETPEDYYEYVATCDNGWYTFRGTYGNGLTLDDVVSGHSGYGHQHSVDGALDEWFNEEIAPRLTMMIKKIIATGNIIRLDDTEY